MHYFFFVFLRLNNILLVCDILLLHNPYAVFRVVCMTSRFSASAPHYSPAGLVVRATSPRSRLCPVVGCWNALANAAGVIPGVRVWGKTWPVSRTIATSCIINELSG